MQIKHYLLITILFILGKATMATAQTCDLPASDTFVNVINLPTYKTYTFSPVAGAIGYQVKVTNLSTNVTQTLILPGSATGFSVTTEPGDHIAELCAICPNNIPSLNRAIVPTSDTIIVVDLVGGYQNQCTPSEINCEKGGIIPSLIPFSCTAPGTSETYQFSFKYSGGLSDITVYGSVTHVPSPVSGALPQFNIQQVTGNPNNWIFQNTKAPNSPGSNTAVRIRPQASTIDRFDISAHAENGGIVLKFITATSAGASFSDFKLYSCRGGGGGRERDDNGQNEASGNELGTEKALNVLVSPNPFNDNLTLTMEAPETGNVSVQLYNLTGGLQKSLEITPAELTNNTYTIPTADLATGMYIMQVSTEQGVRHTSKVFKL